MKTQSALDAVLDHYRSGRVAEADVACRALLQGATLDTPLIQALGMIALQAGSSGMAIELFDRLTVSLPNHIDAHFYLGNALLQEDRLTDAEASYRRALALAADHAEAIYQLAVIHHLQGRLDEAIAGYQQAIALQPDAPAKHGNLGVALDAQGRFDEAAHSLRKSLAIEPRSAETHFNLGNTLKSLGKLDEAIACYRRALELRADFVDALDNLGVALQENGRLDEAVSCYRRALALHPDWPQTLANLGIALREQGKIDEAIAICLRAVQLGETAETRIAFVQAIRQVAFTRESPGLRPLVKRAIEEPWGRPAELLAPALSLVMLDPAIRDIFDRAQKSWPHNLDKAALFGGTGLAAATDELLIMVLENMQANDDTLERFLTMARAVLLYEADRVASELLPFWCALARQCFINGYVFAQGDDEARHVAVLRDDVEAMLAAAAGVPHGKLMALAAYFPLHGILGIERLLEQRWPAGIDAVLTQQVREPARERVLAAATEPITPISGEVSRRVRQQYEENPYPRWVKVPPGGKPVLLAARLGSEFPLLVVESARADAPLEILIAGCGTGQHSIETAREYRNARVLAVDLSLASLAYAQRKSEELGVTNIEYAQADIMELAQARALADRCFDLIESVGVLHHLADPVAGWRVLLTLLKPRGMMRLGFYSERARRAVVAARAYIAMRGYGTRAGEIRRCRQEIFAQVRDHGTGSPYAQLLTFRDFYGTSECRDLLFHVQEHRYQLPQLKQIFDELNLQFIGFTLEPDIRRLYDAHYPGDPARVSLDNWHALEMQFPDTFAGMYQFWVQKRH